MFTITVKESSFLFLYAPSRTSKIVLILFILAKVRFEGNIVSNFFTWNAILLDSGRTVHLVLRLPLKS